MRAIVLVKQVPDLRVGSVGVHPDGTIDRILAEKGFPAQVGF